jgi:toxin-antitoxin system PIN domain toxin
VILPDVNVLLYAFRDAAQDHAAYRDWLERTVASDEAFALSEFVLSAVVRIATHPRVFSPPSTLANALAFCDALRGQPNAVLVSPGPRQWDIFARLCVSANATGSLVPNAYLAALAIEHGCEFVSTDRGYARFAGLRWRHPLAD